MKKTFNYKRLLYQIVKMSFLQSFIVLVFSSVTMATNVNGQEMLAKHVSINMKEATLEKVLTKLEKSANVKFSFNSRMIKLDKKVSITANNELLSQVLTKVLKPLNITFLEVSNRIILRNVETPRATSENMGEASFENIEGVIDQNVSGTIKDENGKPLAGVNITIKGTVKGTNSDENGQFKIDIEDENSILVFSYVGYAKQEVLIGKRTVFTISMAIDQKSLDEVVVVAYGTQNKKTISGAISTVNADELSHSKTATAAGALVGKIPGLNFRQNTGRPGSEPSIQIRNIGTPLVIIDGAVRDMGSFSQMDFNDIESVSVLKDGSAAIYGMQAANGAIVVTTKKGKRNQKLKVGLQSYFGVQKASGYNKPADAVTYLRAIIQDETYNGVSENARTIKKDEYEKWVNKVDDDHTSFDWYNYIWQTAPQFYNSINLSGGSDNVDYYVSVGNLQQQGLLRNFVGFSRTNFQSNINANISKRFKIGFGMQGRLEHNEQPGLPGDDYSFAEETAFRNLPTKKPYHNGNEDYPLISTIDPQYSYGWVGYKTSGKYQAESRVILINGTAELEIAKGFKARGLFTYWYKNYKTDLLELSPILYSYDKASSQYNVAYSGNGRYVERFIQNNEEVTTNLQLEYKKSFGNHNLFLFSGMEGKRGTYPSVYIWGSPVANGIQYLTNATPGITVTDNISYVQKRLGFIGRLNYDFEGKYIAEFSTRYDGSYFYQSGSRFGFFPYGSVAYRISQENFWKNNGFLSNTFNDLKLRASYGIAGKELGSALSFITGYNYNTGNAILNGANVTTSTVSGLPTVYTWGRVKTLNVGLDVVLLDNRLKGGFDWFSRHQTGELGSRYDVLLPNEVGFGLPSENLNGDYTKGVEFSLDWKDKIKDINYWVGGNFSFSRWITGERYKPHWSSAYNQYRDLGSTEGRYRDGSFQLIAIGQFKTWEEIAKYPIDQDHAGNTTLRPGDYIYQDTNGDGYITELDMKNVTYRTNSGTPWINFAFNFGANWKGIDVRADFVGASAYTYEQQGYLRYFDPNANVSQYLADNSTWYKDIWDKNSGFNIGKYPLLTKGVNNWMNTHWPNSYWQTNITYVKLRNLEIGYTLPTVLTKRAGISNLRFYFAGYNMLTISNMPSGLDPEITSSSGNSYPNPKVYNFGFQASF